MVRAVLPVRLEAESSETVPEAGCKVRLPIAVDSVPAFGKLKVLEETVIKSSEATPLKAPALARNVAFSCQEAVLVFQFNVE